MRSCIACTSSLIVTMAVMGAADGLAGAGGSAGASPPDPGTRNREPGRFEARPFPPPGLAGRFGDAVAYGPHRDGQYPGGPAPSREEIRQDLHLIARHWGLLRMYGASGPADATAGGVPGPAETVLQVIRADGLGLKVMLGAWIAPQDGPVEGGDATAGGGAAANRRELEAAIRLAAAYPEIVVAICVGNETQVSWSAHRVPADLLLACVREVRARTEVPVTVADDLKYWLTPPSRALAAEVDFITLHAHPLWNGIELDAALPWLQGIVADVSALHPDRPVVLGETGWATARSDEGEQARLIRGRTGEGEQAAFHRAVTGWARREGLVLFWFEAFDENWKGGDDPDEVEKHWGLYRSDRTPKEALADGS